MKLDIDFCDDRPISARDWDEYKAPPKFWRDTPTPKLTRQEVATAGIIALLTFVFVMVIWVCLLVF